MHAFSYLISLIITEIYTPLVTALDTLPLLSQSIDNGAFVFTFSTLFATILTLVIFGLFVYLPIYIIKFLKGVI